MLACDDFVVQSFFSFFSFFSSYERVESEPISLTGAQTLFKELDATLMHAAGLNTFNTALKLNCLPYWMCLLTLGHQGIVARITHACDLVSVASAVLRLV